MPNSLPRLTQTCQSKGKPAAKTPLQWSPWTMRLPMSVGIGVAHAHERHVLDPSPLPGTRTGKVQTTRVPRLRLPPSLRSLRRGLANRARVP